MAIHTQQWHSTQNSRNVGQLGACTNSGYQASFSDCSNGPGNEAKKALELSKIDQENQKLETVTPPIHCLSLSLKTRMKLSRKGNPFLKLVQNRIQLSLWVLNHLLITLLLYWATRCQPLLHSVSGSGHHLLVSWGSPDGRSAAGAWAQSLRSSSLCSLVRPCLWNRQQDNRSLAIEQVFSGAKIFLCNFHCEQCICIARSENHIGMF